MKDTYLSRKVLKNICEVENQMKKGSLRKILQYGLNYNCLYFGVREKPKEITMFSFLSQLNPYNH